MHTRTLVIAAIFFSFTGVATAGTPVYWTPTHMANALTALQYPHQGILGTRCAGTTKARRGTYASFRCVAKWQVDGTNGASNQSGTVVAFARPLAHGRVCGSTSRTIACKPLARGPLAGDPTVCTLTRPDPAAQAQACVHANATTAVVAHTGSVDTRCSSTATITATRVTTGCVSAGQQVTVVYVRGVSAWTSAVTP